MRNSKYILIIALFSTSYLKAQTVDQNLTVEREYKPTIQDAGKITSIPEIIELNIENKPAKYTDFNLPLSVGQNIYNLSPAELEREKRRISNGAFIRLGVGNYMNTVADFALPIINKPKTKLDLKLNHTGTFDSEKTRSYTSTALMFDQYLKSLDIYAGMGLSHEYFKFYGKSYDKNGLVINIDTLAQNFGASMYEEKNFVRVNRTANKMSLNEISNIPDNDVFWRYNAYVGIRSLPNELKNKYLGEFEYKTFDSRIGLTENIFHTKFDFNKLLEKNRVGIHVNLQNMIYKSDLANAVINAWDSYAVFDINPYYSIERTNFDVRLGIKSSFSFMHGRPFNPSPDIHAEWKIAPKVISIYGGIGGAYNVNTLDLMFTENRYLFSDLRVKDTYTPVSAYFGFKLKPIYNLLLDAYVNYQYIDNQYFFINKDFASVTAPNDSIIYTNRFNAIYSRASLVKVGARVNYNIRNRLNVELKGAYNGWKVFDTELAWNKPKYEADLTADLRLNRNLVLTTNVFFESERFAKFGNVSERMSPKIDVNIGASYSYLNWLTFYAKANNLLNKKYQNFYGYEVQGLNVLVGASVSF